MIEQEFTEDMPEEATRIRSETRKQLRPMNSLAAAATRLTSAKLKGQHAKRSLAENWQDEAWELYDLVGEQRFLATTLAGRLSQARLFVGKLPDDPTETPIAIEADKAAGPDETALEVFKQFASGSPTQVAQIISRLGVNLFVAGDGWICGIPRALLHGADIGRPVEDPQRTGTPQGGIPPIVNRGPDPADPDDPDAAGPGTDDSIDLDDLEWRMFSVNEVSIDEEQIVIQVGDGEKEKIKAPADDLMLIRVWRPHPQRWWQADSPTRASLPVLRELVGLTMHISAQVDSRLAGAGVFLVPTEAGDAIRRSNQNEAEDDPEDTDGDDSPFADSLMKAMTEPINDRSSASAIVPLTVEVPGDTIEKFRHIKFASDLDAEARELRDEAIRRLALGQDAPPEILLGTGGMNHWGAWLVREDTITTHLEPPLALICDALTTQFLRPVLEQQGMSSEEAEKYVFWYDVSDLILRPNKGSDAVTLHGVGAISDAALRDAVGFGDEDAPEQVAAMDPAVSMAFELVKNAPSLAQAPGIGNLVEQIRAVMTGAPAPEIPTDDPSQGDPVPDPDEETPEEGPADGGPPDTDGDDAEPPAADDQPVAAGAGPVVDGQPMVPVKPYAPVDPYNSSLAAAAARERAAARAILDSPHAYKPSIQVKHGETAPPLEESDRERAERLRARARRIETLGR